MKILEIVLDKAESIISTIKYNLRPCNFGHHEWIYKGEGENVFTERYCEKCSRHEKFCHGNYYRVKDISYNERY